VLVFVIRPLPGSCAMSAGFWPVIAIIAFVAAWVIAKVFFYMRRSDEQWRDVDKSKLKEWDDEDD